MPEQTDLEKALAWARHIRDFDPMQFSPNEKMILTLAAEVERLRKLVPKDKR